MRWIREHKLIAGLLALLLVLILVFLLSLGDRENNTVTGGINKAMSYVSRPFTAVTRTVRSTVSGIFSYKSLQAQVDELTAEKEELERELAQSSLKKSELEPNLKIIREDLELPDSCPIIPFSAEKGDGRDALVKLILQAVE